MTQAPTGTYRVQVRPEFGFDDVAALVDHLTALPLLGCTLNQLTLDGNQLRNIQRQ